MSESVYVCLSWHSLISTIKKARPDLLLEYGMFGVLFWLVGWVGWLVGWLGWLGWLVGWLGWLIGWWVGWLVE